MNQPSTGEDPCAQNKIMLKAGKTVKVTGKPWKSSQKPEKCEKVSKSMEKCGNPIQKHGKQKRLLTIRVHKTVCKLNFVCTSSSTS